MLGFDSAVRQGGKVGLRLQCILKSRSFKLVSANSNARIIGTHSDTECSFKRKLPDVKLLAMSLSREPDRKSVLSGFLIYHSLVKALQLVGIRA